MMSCQGGVIMTRCCIATCLTTMRAQQKFYNDTSVLVSLIALFFNAIIILKSFVYSCCQRVKLVCIYRAPFELYAILCKKAFIQLNKVDH